MTDATMTPPDDGVAALLCESVRDFVARARNLKAFRERMQQPPGHDPGHPGQMRDLGWHSVLIAEAYGGLGMGLREASLIAEGLGRGLLGDLYAATSVLPVCLLQDRAAQPPAAAWLERLAQGQCLASLAWQERPDDIDSGAVSTQAVAQAGGGYAISGTKSWAVGAQAASMLLVTARLQGGEDGIAVFAVPRDAAGVSMQADVWQVDGQCSPVVELRQVAVPRDALLVRPGEGLAALGRALDAARIVASAELLGVMGEAFDMTLDYLKTRVQYDKVIGSFQALQHKAVDLLVQRELAAAAQEEAALADPEDGARFAAVASRCKARCSDAALRITRECIQLHGAIGYTHEYDLGLYVKRALVLSAWLGNGAQQRHRFWRRHVMPAERGGLFGTD